MENHHIKLVIEGLESDEGHVRLEYFLKALESLQSSLSKLDCKAAGGKRASDFVVVGLSHNSPATVELEARQIKNRPDVRALIFNKFNSAVSSIQGGIIPEDVDYSILEDLKKIAAPVGRGVTAAQLSVGNEQVDLTEAFAKKIEVALADVEYCHGSVEGRLEKINIHAGADVFTVYPEFGAERISCHFPRNLREKAIAAINRRVSVYGNMRFRKNSPFPHHIEIDHLEIYQDADALPSFDDLRGIAPSAGGGAPSEEIIRGLRNDWQ